MRTPALTPTTPSSVPEGLPIEQTTAARLAEHCGDRIVGHQFEADGDGMVEVLLVERAGGGVVRITPDGVTG